MLWHKLPPSTSACSSLTSYSNLSPSCHICLEKKRQTQCVTSAAGLLRQGSDAQRGTTAEQHVYMCVLNDTNTRWPTGQFLHPAGESITPLLLHTIWQMHPVSKPLLSRLRQFLLCSNDPQPTWDWEFVKNVNTIILMSYSDWSVYLKSSAWVWVFDVVPVCGCHSWSGLHW